MQKQKQKQKLKIFEWIYQRKYLSLDFQNKRFPEKIFGFLRKKGNIFL